MATMQEITCACGCGRKKMVRTADVKRGWGKFYSKSCKAKAQERRTGQYRAYLYKKQDANHRDDDSFRSVVDVEDDFYAFDSYNDDQWD